MTATWMRIHERAHDAVGLTAAIAAGILMTP